MKAALSFGIGVFACEIVVSETQYLFQMHEMASIIHALPGFLVYLFVGWVAYAIGAAVFKRNVSVLVAFFLGVVAMLIQRAFMANFAARTTLNLNSRDALINSDFGDLISACAQLLLPIIVFAFLAPAIGRRRD